MELELQGKVAIVTGAAAGIGRRTAELFCEVGARVVLADVDEENGEAAAQAIGSSAVFRRTDVSKAEDVQALVDFAVERFGGLNVMVNNAAIMGSTAERFLDDDYSDFQQVMGVNLLGVMLGSQFAARHMAANGGGSIINLSSVAGMVAGFAYHKYRSSKAGIIHFSKSIAIDLAEHMVRVNCIVPGSVKTGIASYNEPGMDQETADRLQAALAPVRTRNRPLPRQAMPEDVAQAALYLASDRAAQVTGISFPVDGGITAGDPVNQFRALLRHGKLYLASSRHPGGFSHHWDTSRKTRHSPRCLAASRILRQARCPQRSRLSIIPAYHSV